MIICININLKPNKLDFFNFQNKGKCQFDLSSLGECGTSPYGYMPEDETMKPCLFIKLNKIYNFDPKPVDASNLDDPMFDSMTTQLKVYDYD